MSMDSAWASLPGAPAPGSVLCHSEDVPLGGTLCLRLQDFPIVIVRKDNLLRAFVNACPHQYLPLDYKGDKLLSSDCLMLRCTNHAAGFSVIDGQGTEGLGLGLSLDGIPISGRADGMLIIGEK